MTDILARIRAAALDLPEVEERGGGFCVADNPFVRLANGSISILDTDGWASLAGDETMVENRIATSWELAAPRRLLEAGGR